MEQTTATISTGGDSITLTMDQLDTMNTMDGESPLLAELGDIHAAWNDRKKELTAERLQWANDTVYEHIRDHVIATSATIRDVLVGAAHLAERSSEMTVSIFSYNTAVFHQGKERTAVPPQWENVVVAQDERVRVHEVFQDTDILMRLSAMFGSNFEVTTLLSPIAGAMTMDYTPMRCYVNITFHPDGVHPALLRAMLAAHDSYAKYVPHPCGRIVTGSVVNPEEEDEDEERYYKGHD